MTDFPEAVDSINALLLDSHAKTLETLQQQYEALALSAPFSEALRDFIRFAVAKMAAGEDDVALSPPFHVDGLWHLCLVKSVFYRSLEEICSFLVEHFGRSYRALRRQNWVCFHEMVS